MSKALLTNESHATYASQKLIDEQDEIVVAAENRKHARKKFPHEAGCNDCYRAQICSCCGAQAVANNRCANGHCGACHVTVCQGNDGLLVGGTGVNTPALRKLGRFSSGHLS